MRTETEVRILDRMRGGCRKSVLCRLVYEVSWMPELRDEPKWRWQLTRIEELDGHDVQ